MALEELRLGKHHEVLARVKLKILGRACNIRQHHRSTLNALRLLKLIYAKWENTGELTVITAHYIEAQMASPIVTEAQSDLLPSAEVCSAVSLIHEPPGDQANTSPML